MSEDHPPAAPRYTRTHKRNPSIVWMLVAVGMVAAAGTGFWMLNRGGPDSLVAIVGENVNCRAAPDIDAAILQRLNGYAEFDSDRSEGDWVRLLLPGREACWANAEFVVLDADTQPSPGQAPRILTYLRAGEPVSDGASQPIDVRSAATTTHDLAGDWVWHEAACRGTDGFFGFRENNVFYQPDMGPGSWSQNGNTVTARWDAYPGDEITDPHEAGSAFGRIDWMDSNHITIFWEGGEGVALVRCPD